MDLDAPTLADWLASGRVSAEAVTLAALDRIAELDDAGPMLNAVIELNPDALAIARELDERFADGGPVGPLHGMPVALKANIDTADQMATSAGSLALADHHSGEDAPLVAQLRAAGAVIIAKTNLSEWANFRGDNSSSGWSSLGGQTKNPHVLDRSPCGSSSGSAVAVAALMLPLAVGTETDGSIVCPAAVNGIVGIKPTHDSVAREGIIPIAASQDVAGPFARTVEGAAMLLAALRDPGNSGPALRIPVAPADVSQIRIGVLRDYFGAGDLEPVEAEFSRWLEQLDAAGAALFDPVELALPETLRTSEFEVLLYEFYDGINAYLEQADAPIASLEQLIEFNLANADAVMPHFGQELFVAAEERGNSQRDVYRDALAESAEMRERLRSVFQTLRLDALVAPVTGPAWPIDWQNGDEFSLSSSYVAAISGFPSVAVPAGQTESLPLSIAFIGLPDTEADLIEIAAAFEVLRGPLSAPEFIATID
jgi:amidase